MKTFGLTIAEGARVVNLTVAQGTSFPTNPDEGELFFRSDTAVNVRGLYVYIGGSWDRIASSDSLSVPIGTSFPTSANEGDLFYLNTNDSNENLYVYKNSSWTVVGGEATSIDWANITNKPTTLSGYGITDAQPLDATLTALAAFNSNGIVVQTATDTFASRSIAVSGTGLSISNADGSSGNPTITSNATSANTASTIVARDSSGNFSAGTITASLSGNASTATALQTGRTFSLTGDATGTSGSFDGTANASISVTLSNTSVSPGTYGSASQVGTFTVDSKGRLTSAGNTSIAIDASQVTSGTFSNSLISESSVIQHQGALSIAETQIPNGSILARVNDSETISGSWSFSNPVTVGTPSASNHAVTKQYVDSLTEGLATKPAVEIVVTSNLAATYNNGSGGVGATLTATSNGAFPTIDGVTLTSTTLGQNGVLVAGQTNPAYNGRYNLTQVGDSGNPWILTRCALCDEASEIPGSYTFVKQGTQYAGSGWVQTVANPVTFTVGTDAITVTQFSGSGAYSAGTGLVLNGSEFALSNSNVLSLFNLAANGLITRTAANTVTARSISVSGIGLSITNADGVSGNPTITLSSTPSATANTIVSRDSGGHSVFNNAYVLGAFITDPNSRGYTTVNIGDSTHSGFIAFYSSTGVRQGYIGYTGTNTSTDTGTIPYVAGLHNFYGRVNANTQTAGSSTIGHFTSNGSNGVTVNIAGGTNDYSTGTAAGDSVIRAEANNLCISPNNGKLIFSGANGIFGNFNPTTLNLGLGGTFDASDVIHVYRPGTGTTVRTRYVNDTGSSYCGIDGPIQTFQIATDQPNGIAFQTGGSYTRKMHITSDGNVGIGGPSNYSAAVPLEVRRPEASASYVVPSNTTLNDNTAVVARFSYGVDNATIPSGSGIGIALSATPNRGEAFIVHRHPNDNKDVGELSFWTTFLVAYERMRIDYDGNILIGANTNPNIFRLVVEHAGTRNGIVVRDTATSGSTSISVESRFSQAAATNFFHFRAVVNNATDVFNVIGNGNVLNTNNSYGALSDATLKQDITNAGSQWDDIKNIKIRKYRLKTDPAGPQHLGVIAQEAEEVSPGLVEEVMTGNEDRPPVKSVKYSILYLKAVKALQEAMERIEQLEEKVRRLEGK